MRLAVVYVQYNTQKYPDSLRKLRSYLSKARGLKPVYVVVDNRDEGDGWHVGDDNSFYLQGNNRDREFSGWQLGIDFLHERNIKCDVILFVNEAFESIRPSYLEKRSVKWLTLKSMFLHAVIGYVDTVWEKGRINGRVSRIWVNTNCFFMPAALTYRLGDLVSIDSDAIANYLPEKFPGYESVFVDDAPIDRVYRRRIIRWLTEEWHSRFELTDATWPLFRAKAIAILNEALLSIRIRDLGAPILPDSVPFFFLRKARGLIRKLRRSIVKGADSTESLFSGRAL